MKNSDEQSDNTGSQGRKLDPAPSAAKFPPARHSMQLRSNRRRYIQRAASIPPPKMRPARLPPASRCSTFVVPKVPSVPPGAETTGQKECGPSSLDPELPPLQKSHRSLKRKLDPAPIDGTVSPATPTRGMQLRPRSRPRPAVSPPKQLPRARRPPSVPVPASAAVPESKECGPRAPIGSEREKMIQSSLKRGIAREKRYALIEQKRAELWKRLGNPDRRIPPPKGITQLELQLCGPYLMKQSFEIGGGPIPDNCKYIKTFLDQVRISPYQVQVQYQASLYAPAFIPMTKDMLERLDLYRDRLKLGTELVSSAVKKKFKGKYRVEDKDGFNNFVKIKFYWLLSLPAKDDQGTPHTVEALFAKMPGTSPLKFLEWKIKQGSDLIFCSVPTMD